jgi:nucleoside-diphosphate-sugar epimerase
MIPGLSGGPAPVLVLGATGAVGRCLLARLSEVGVPIIAVSRRVPEAELPNVMWMQHDLEREPLKVETHVLLSAGPLALARRQLERLPAVRRVIALGSASVRFKQDSPDPAERAMMRELADAELRLGEWAERRAADVTLLRPTLIYGGEHDRNISIIAEAARTRKWLPIAGRGLRQPVHADDLARLMTALVARQGRGFEVFDLGGGETLPYPDFVRRIASSAGADPSIVQVPSALLTAGLRMAHLFGRMKTVTPAMIRRQRMDLTVDDIPAREHLGWNPRPFRPSFSSD